jgi:hypothetical protein
MPQGGHIRFGSGLRCDATSVSRIGSTAVSAMGASAGATSSRRSAMTCNSVGAPARMSSAAAASEEIWNRGPGFSRSRRKSAPITKLPVSVLRIMHAFGIGRIGMRDPDPAQRRAPVPEALIGDVEHLRRLDVALGQRRRADGRRPGRRGVAGSEHELTGIAAGGDAEGESDCKDAASADTDGQSSTWGNGSWTALSASDARRFFCRCSLLMRSAFDAWSLPVMNRIARSRASENPLAQSWSRAMRSGHGFQNRSTRRKCA